MRTICFILMMLTFNSSLKAQWWKTYPYHKEGTLIYFPQDEGHHPEYKPGSGTEWWYVNMHLQGETTKHNYSAMVAYFNYHFRIFNVTDETNHDFLSFTDFGLLNVSEDNLELKFTLLTGGTEHWFTKTDSLAQLLPFQYHLNVGNDNNNLNLDLDAQKPPLIIGMDGLVTIGSGDSYYYSQTMLTISGNLTFRGNTEPVSGIAWIDHQYGPFFVAPGGDESYEWFSLQLDNGIDINLWNIFTDDNKIPNDGSHRICSIYLDDQTQDTTSTFSLERLSFWKYIENFYYSNGWRFCDPIHKIDLTITPMFHDQVVPFFLLPFWEGSCLISGIVDGDSVKGHGFAELLHIYEPPKITVISPNGGEMWDGSNPILWKLENPDDGNPLRYDIYYKIGANSPFSPIVTAISDTSYLWDVSGLAKTDSCLIKIVGYSVDSTITGEDTSDNIFSIVSPTQVGNSTNSKPIAYKLFQNYPNPFNTQTTIKFEIKGASKVSLKIFNTQGQLVKILLDDFCDESNKRIQWDTTDFTGNLVSSGIYFYRLIVGQYVETKRMLLLR